MEENDLALKKLLILGIPVDNIPAKKAIEQIETWIRDKGKPSRFVVFLSAQVVTKAVGWNPMSSDYPEMIAILRQADLVLPDIDSILWYFLTLGHRSEELPSYRQLLGQLLEKLERDGKSVLVMSSSQAGVDRLKLVIQEKYPKLKLTALPHYSFPFLGEDLAEAKERDTELVNDINKINPDLLLLALEHPQQEIWFNRVKENINVPVTLGLGNLEKSIQEDILPEEQTGPFQWLYREMKRFVHDPIQETVRIGSLLFQVPYLTAPILGLYSANAISKRGQGKNEAPIPCRSFPFDKQEMVIFSLPPQFTAHYINEFLNHLKAYKTATIILFDFGEVIYVDATALGTLMELWTTLSGEGKDVIGVGIHTSVKQAMRWHRAWDFFEPRSYAYTELLSRYLVVRNVVPPLMWQITQHSPFTVATIFGLLDARQVHTDIFSSITNKAIEPKVIIDLSWCHFIDNSGVGLLLRIRKHFQQLRKSLYLTGINHTVKQTLKLSKVDTLFTITETLFDAFEEGNGG